MCLENSVMHSKYSVSAGSLSLSVSLYVSLSLSPWSSSRPLTSSGYSVLSSVSEKNVLFVDFSPLES